MNRADIATVVHVAAHYPPYLGGLEKVVQELAVHRRKLGSPVKVVTSDDGVGPDSPADEAEYVQRLPYREVARTALMPGLFRALSQFARPAILHVHAAQAYVPEIAYAVHHRHGLPYIVHLHIDVGPSGPAGFLLKAYKPLVLGRVLRAAAFVVVFTEDQRAAVAQRYRLDPAHVVVVPNGVSEDFFSNEPRALPNRPKLLFVGRLAAQKNVPLLLEALDGVSERFDTVLVGDGELEVSLRSMVEARGLQNVLFHGRADGESLRRLYREADVFVLPSEREGMPLVLLEALAMGLPVVATDIPGTRDVIQNGSNGALAAPGDARAFRAALLHVTSDPAQYRRMSQTSRALADRYSWDSVATKFDALYDMALGAHERDR
jgi:glycosyltransferase involved in cell wall biosynthesis